MPLAYTECLTCQTGSTGPRPFGGVGELVAKLTRYARGAPSYWIVDPRDHHELRDGYFVETGRFTGGRADLAYGGVTVSVEVDDLLC